MTERRLSIDMGELEAAFEDASDAVRYYLDRETGLVVAITDEIRGELEAIYEELDDEHGQEDDVFADALRQRALPEWMHALIGEAHAVEQDYGARYIAVPTADSREGYRDMEDFIATVGNPQLRSQLACAIQGRGAFRRFKDTLLTHPAERERWFAFSQARVRERVLAWLAEEGLAVATEASEDNRPQADREQEKSGSAS
jgi:elongation factor P hydroxylase